MLIEREAVEEGRAQELAGTIEAIKENALVIRASIGKQDGEIITDKIHI